MAELFVEAVVDAKQIEIYLRSWKKDLVQEKGKINMVIQKV